VESHPHLNPAAGQVPILLSTIAAMTATRAPGIRGVEVIVVRLATSTLGELVVQLTPWEKVGALHGDLRVPLSAVRAVSVVGEPWKALRGIRAPGTGWPSWIMLGTARGKFGKDFAAVYRRRPAILVELTNHEFQRLLLCTADPQRDAEALQAALPPKT
jgi:hypothetical protein